MTTRSYYEEIGLVAHGGKLLLRTYVIGFVLSLLLTGLAYKVAVDGLVPFPGSYFALAILAITQFIVQIVYFLHLGREKGSRAKLGLLAGVSVAVAILVGGSIWIMMNLHGRMALPEDMNTYMEEQTGL